MAKKTDEQTKPSGKWQYIYALVLLWLLVQIALYYLLTISYQ